MNRVIIYDLDFATNDCFVIEDPLRTEHLMEHIKIELGQTIKFCHLNTGLGTAELTKQRNTKLHFKVLTRSPGQHHKTTLIVGLSRPPICKKILEHGSALGVSQFKFFQAALSQKSYRDSKIFSKEQINRLLEAGLSQSALYYKLPQVEILNSYTPSPRKQYYFLSLTTDKSWKNYQLDFSREINLIIGPERGWTDSEEQNLIEQGALPVSICESTLRVEIACFVALGQLHQLRGP